MTPLLEIKDLTKDFVLNGSGETVRAVNKVSFDLRKKEIFGILGQSGSGKTTLVRSLLRLEQPTSGSVLYQGHDIVTMSKSALREVVRSNIRLVFQHPEAVLNPAFTVRKILDQAMRRHTTLNPAERHVRAKELLDSVRLSPLYLNKNPHEMSGGQKRRIVLCRALATNPSIIIADEPLSGLDVSIQAQIVELLRDLRDQFGIAMIIISHDIGSVQHICDRIGIMYQGEMVEIGPARTLSEATCQHWYTKKLYASHLSISTFLPSTG